MTRMMKRLISLAMALLLCLQTLPLQAMAALLDNSPAYNQEILDALTEIVGSEDEASQYYALLEHYGLLDEDGNLSESWEIWMDGEQVTLADIQTALADPYCDQTKQIIVDDKIVTLGDIETILAIENYIEELRAKYFDGYQWTAEQQANLMSLMNQIETEGIQLSTSTTDPVGASGVNHNARVSVDVDANGAVTATLTNAAPNQTVSFDWEALSGTQPVSGSGTVTLTAAKNTATIPVVLKANDRVASQQDLTYYIDLRNLTNALFDNGYPHMTEVVTVAGSATLTQTILENLQLVSSSIPIHFGDASQDDTHINDRTKVFNHSKMTNDSPDLLYHGIKWGIWNYFGVEYISEPQISQVYEFDASYVGAGEVYLRAYTGDAVTGDTVAGTPFYEIRSYREAYNHLGDFGTVGATYPVYDDLLITTQSNPEASFISNLDELLGNLDDDCVAFTIEVGGHYPQVFLRMMDQSNSYSTAPDYSPHNFDNSITSAANQMAHAYKVDLYIKDTEDPTLESITAPAGTYYPGQIVPITVKFSEPVSVAAGGIKLVVNGETLTSAAAVGNVFVFPYTVKQTDNLVLSINTDTSSVTYSEINANGGTEQLGNTIQTFIGTISTSEFTGISLETPYKPDAISNVTATVTGPAASQVLTVEVAINTTNVTLTEWLKSAQDENGRSYADTLSVSLDNGTTMHKLYYKGDSLDAGLIATIPLTPNTTDSPKSHVAELFMAETDTDGNTTYSLLVGKANVGTQPAAEYITGFSTFGLTVKESDGTTDYAYTVEDGNNIIYPQDNPRIQAYYTLDNKDYTYAAASDFQWTSSDTSIANIDANGLITPTGTAGSVTFTLTALNGDVSGKAYSQTTETLHFGAGLTPYISIPEERIETVANQQLTVFWSSNILDKNGTDNVTEFTVEFFEGNATKAAHTEKVVNAAGFTIPGNWLQYDYTEANANTYKLKVSTVFNGVGYSDEVTIFLDSEPAIVTLNELANYYLIDEQKSVTISWVIENFDLFSSESAENLFRFEVVKGDQAKVSSADPGNSTADSGGTYSGQYVLNLDDVIPSPSSPNSYREVYTVTIQAKNGAQSTWSYDSFLLYVYDADALKIMVDGEAKGSTTMSNVSAISKMTQAQILALKRDIYLKNIISANYGEYAWTEVADQIAWASLRDDGKTSGSDIASINYQQGTLYENIEDFTYVSYRPTTEFGLAGLKDGEATITATHKLTGMTDTLDVTVETLKDKLYLFQCYPQAKTTLRYQDSTGEWQTVTSDPNGAAVIFEEKGIHSNVYCSATVTEGTGENTETITYLGTFYRDDLASGEGDWTKLERYPCNNLTMRRAAYAYLYLKEPDGTPYIGDINFRGGVYVNGAYVQEAYFGLNGHPVTQKGYENNTVDLGADGKLTVIMDQTQWPNGAVTAEDDVRYVFEISQAGSTDYYPLFVTVDATVNIGTFVGNGEAIVTFRGNPEAGKHPFIIAQSSAYTGYSHPTDVLDTTGKIGPNSNFTEASLTTSVMWWEDASAAAPSGTPRLQLVTTDGFDLAAAAGQYTISHTAYPFASMSITEYTVMLNEDTMKGISLGSGKSIGLYLDYYRDGAALSRRETLPFTLTNLLGVEAVQNAKSITEMLSTMGSAVDTNDKQTMGFGDQFVQVAMNLVSSDSYSTGDQKLFRIQLAPTSDPTKFLGFIEVNLGNMRDKDQVTGVYAPGSETGAEDIDKTPGLSELMVLAKKRSIYSYLMDDLNHVLKREKVRNLKMQLGGYAESLIYFDENSGKWEIQVLNGGFNLGGGVTYSWNWNWMAGPVPFTATLEIGGTVEVDMDALSVAYYNKQKDATYIGTDFLTELRVYLYLKFFAGVGIDYAIIAFKLGIFGQISLDMRFRWLNRPYMDTQDDVYNIADKTHNEPTQKFRDVPVLDEDGNIQFDETGQMVTEPVEYWVGAKSKLNGQHFKIDGQIGLEFIVRFLFFSYEKILFSYSFNLLNEPVNDWVTIDSNWEKNKAAQMSAISALLGNKSLSVTNVGGQQMLSLNLAPTLESRDYLEEGSFWNDGSFSMFALDRDESGKVLQYNSYPYANPVVTDDGAIVAYLSDMDSSNVEDTRAAFALKNVYGMYNEGSPIDNDGFGDSQIAIAGDTDFAVSAWTRQMVSIDKDAGAELTADDQMIMMDGTEIYAAVYQSTPNASTDASASWSTTRLTENSSADLAPVVATNGSRAIVAWRAVESSGKDVEVDSNSVADVTTFDEKDSILYRIYNGTAWSDTYTLYNGTSGAVKGITAAMLEDGTAAVAYTLDTGEADRNGNDSVTDREIFYAVIDKQSNEVTRNVRATNDAYLDENPQLTTVTFPDGDNNEPERFVLGWYTEQAVASDNAETLDGGAAETNSETMADIRLLDFNAKGIHTQHMPDSISQAASAYDVSITPSFRFTKNADSITDLSILWVERVGSGSATVSATQEANKLMQELSAEKDILKGVKFYTYGENSELISFTGAVNVAEMADSTLIDHFDAYVSDKASNEIKAVILGTTYGTFGTVTATATTVGGDTVRYTTPSKTTSMYTATETYQDKIEVPAVLVDYETVRKGAATEILFTVENHGIHAINQLEITLPGATTTYTRVKDGLNLLPGDRIQLYADYVVPTNKVEDINYTVKATFDTTTGSTGTAETQALVQEGRSVTTQDLTTDTGMVYLDFPDLEITEATITREVDGERDILIKLNNDSDADLAGSGRKVKISFYSDATCEKPFTELAPETETASDGQSESAFGLAPIYVTDAKDLAMIDEGGYSVSTTFDAEAYLAAMPTENGAPQPTEIPDGGIQIFIMAEIIAAAPETDATVETVYPEVISSNNIANVLCENLKTRTGTDAVVTSTLATDDTGCTVTVNVQNTRLSQTTSGNIIVTLLDKDDKPLGQQQSYGGTNGLITLGAEARAAVAFTFSGEEFKNAASANVTYSDVILETEDTTERTAALTILQFSNLPGITLDSFVAGTDGIYRASVSADRITSTTVMAAAESVNARIQVGEAATEGSNAVSQLVTLIPYTTQDIRITVTNGDVTRVYILTVQNGVKEEAVGPPTSPAPDEDTTFEPVYVLDHSVSVDAPAHGTVTVRPTHAAPGSTVTVTVTSDDGYVLDRLSVTDRSGRELVLTAADGGAYTFRMPDSPVKVHAVFAAAAYPFTDVPLDAYYRDAVLWAVEQGITGGTGGAAFSPDMPCTRAQAVTFLWRAAGSPQPIRSTMQFRDVPADAYYHDAVLWAVEQGITNGITEDSFGPDQVCTRGQIVTFLWRSQGTEQAAANNPFTDVAEGAYYEEAVLWAVKRAITTGTGDNTFSPDAECSRGQIVTFLYRCLAE